MAIIYKDVKLSCEVDGKEDIYFIRLDIITKEDEHVMTLEFADITESFQDMMEVNSLFALYENEELLKQDLSQAHMDRFLDVEEEERPQNLELILNLVAKMKHSHGQCKDGCIHCNPDLGDDLLPDFTFEAKKHDYTSET